MDPVSTGVGIAASLVTMLGLVANSYETLFNLQQRIASAPDDIRLLVSSVAALQILLREIEKASRDLGTNEISAELRELWTKSAESMRTDLAEFDKLTNKLQDKLNSPSIIGIRIWARVRKVLSEQAVRRYQHAFTQHKVVLDSIQAIVQGYF